MLRFLAKRLGLTILVLLGISTVLFFVMRLSGDPAVLVAGPEAGPEVVDSVRHQLGLDRPVYVQYATFLENVVRLQFGDSYRYRTSALAAVLERVPATMELTIAAVILALAVAVPVGILSAVRQGRLSSFFIMLGALTGQSIPGFALGILLVLAFSVHLQWLPSYGRQGVLTLILPMVSLSAFMMARHARLIRAYMVEVLQEDYIRTARAKGLRPSIIHMKHAIRNMLIPVIALIGVDIGQLLGGAVVTETVFAWPGMGRLMVEAVLGRDYPVVQAGVFLVAVFVVLINLVVDLLYLWIDPRISLD